MQSKPSVLIVGGSSGLGLELAKTYAHTHQVFVTGRRDPQDTQVNFIKLDLGFPSFQPAQLDGLFAELPAIDVLIYAAGFYQEGKISDLSDADIFNMANVGFMAPAFLLQRILKKQNQLNTFIAITSTSQWTPRELETVYTGTKAGLGMFANSLSLDERVGKVLVVGPAGMNTRFWEKSGKQIPGLLDPSWVCEQVMNLQNENFKYKFARIMRSPARVELVEMREK